MQWRGFGQDQAIDIVRHVIANLQSRFKGQLSGMYVWNAANSSNKYVFMEEMAKLKEVNERAHDWIMQIQLKHWCVHAFDTDVKSEHTTNNITESFNSWVDKYRGYPALMLLESLRRKMMKRMYKRLEDARKWSSNLPPLVAKKLAERQDEGRFVIVLCASDTEYEVKEESKYFIVNLITRSCDCGLWEVSGIPCKHAMAVITAKRLSAEDYVDAYLTKAAYLRTYSYVIHPIPSQSQWPEVQHPEVLPPEKKRLPGRPKKKQEKGS
ncbi:hypothetical protein LWI28_008666 [Acer negundo]|uniref:SWIM-type domain-containing protein n=1 Tax=Acer negundo TaxID=4023 RepID=A0AAD5JCK9_ACENE|nr:hypothetical protein LWI28_008666 [Acer negundo]